MTTILSSNDEWIYSVLWQNVIVCSVLMKLLLSLQLVLLDLNDHNEMRRTLDDDQRPFSIDDLAKRPRDPSREDVSILIDVFESEVDKYVAAFYTQVADLTTAYQGIFQAVKAISKKLRSLEPSFLTEKIEQFFSFTHSIGEEKCSHKLAEETLKMVIGDLRKAISKRQ